MKEQNLDTLPRHPERPERQNAPLSPRLVVEISRLLRARMQREESGVMAQSTARIVMSHLAVKGSMGQLEIVKLTRLKPPTVSVLLGRMEEEGYIVRIPDEKDRRAVRVTLTEKGVAYDRRQLDRISNNDQIAVAGLTHKEQAVLEDLLLRMRDNLLEATEA